MIEKRIISVITTIYTLYTPIRYIVFAIRSPIIVCGASLYYLVLWNFYNHILYYYSYFIFLYIDKQYLKKSPFIYKILFAIKCIVFILFLNYGLAYSL